MEFLKQYGITIILLLILAYQVYRILSVRLNKNVKNVTAQDAEKLIKTNKDIVILDVRTKNEFSGGHIPNAKLMPVQEIEKRIGELEKYKGKPILVHCASGGRSPQAVKVLLKNKFAPIYHMNHGLRGWHGQLKK